MDWPVLRSASGRLPASTRKSRITNPPSLTNMKIAAAKKRNVQRFQRRLKSVGVKSQRDLTTREDSINAPSKAPRSVKSVCQPQKKSVTNISIGGVFIASPTLH